MNTSNRYTRRSDDGVIYAGPCFLVSVVLTAPDADSDVLVYDHASAASGDIVATVSALNGTTKQVLYLERYCAAGLYANVTGSGVIVDVTYRLA